MRETDEGAAILKREKSELYLQKSFPPFRAVPDLSPAPLNFQQPQEAAVQAAGMDQDKRVGLYSGFQSLTAPYSVKLRFVLEEIRINLSIIRM